MIYEVCVLVATIVLSMLGIELMLWLRSVRKLTNEAKRTIHDINAHLPHILSDVEAVTSLVRRTTEQVGGTVNEAAVGLEELSKNPFRFVTVFVLAVEQVLELWENIRGRKKEAPDR